MRALFHSRVTTILNRRLKGTKLGLQNMTTSIKYLTQIEATNLDAELFSDYAFSVDQLMELAGLSVATAIAKSYPLTKYNKPIVCCGPGNNGGDGLVCARHLSLFGYSPMVICPKPGRAQLYQNLMKQCEKFKITTLNQAPSESLSSLGDLMIDAVFGFSYKPPNRSKEFAKLLNSMHRASKDIPLISIDIPSGWNVENGDNDLDKEQLDIDEELKLPSLRPECLVSLTAPKLCARYFTGRYHYLGGRFVPKSIREKYGLNLPDYPGTDGVMLI